MGEILAVVEDILFLAKVQETARGTGTRLRTTRASDCKVDSFGTNRPAAVLIDLNCRSADPVRLIADIKRSQTEKAIPVVAYLSHVQTGLRQRALEAGADRVLPRSQFSAQLPEILREYTPTEPKEE